MPDIFISNNKITKPDKAPSNNVIPENHIHMLASFCQNPKNVSFENQDPDENILLFLRRHFVTNIPWIFAVFILIIIPLALVFLNNNIPGLFNFNIPGKFMIVSIIFYYLAVFAYSFISFISWYYNISLVTDKRIVDIDYSDVVYHDVAVTKLNLVEDVNYTQTGFIRSLFNYGDVFVQTAGEKPNFDFLAVPNPSRAVNIIEDIIGGPR